MHVLELELDSDTYFLFPYMTIFNYRRHYLKKGSSILFLTHDPRPSNRSNSTPCGSGYYFLCTLYSLLVHILY